MKIVHISDLHVSSVHYVPEWGERVVELVNSMAPEVLVVTGDLTQEVDV
jgi:3',5'-cyclic AMP phosphodiesterase CpdA